MALLGAGAELGGAVLLMVLLGWWLDKKLDTTPWLMLTGAFIGIVGGLYNLYRHGQRFFRKTPANKPTHRNEP
jgi:F0F1-type ATP synthase assembly protein I